MSNRRPKPAPPGVQILTPPEVAASLNISVVTVYRLLKKGKLPAFRIGNEWRFNLEEIERWLTQGANQK